MHIRKGRYIGVAPLPDGLANVCLVVPELAARSLMHAPDVALEAAIVADRRLRSRFDGARRVTEVQVLGPLAVDVSAAGVPGLLLAGDAAGFIDPMTGDGLRIALRGAELAAEAAIGYLDGRRSGSRTSGSTADVRRSWQTSCDRTACFARSLHDRSRSARQRWAHGLCRPSSSASSHTRATLKSS